MEENKDLILPVKKDLDYCKISLENYNSGNFTLLPVKFQYEKNVFVCIGKAKDGVFYHWLQIIGSSNEAKNFNYTLEYFGNDASKTNCKFTGQVFSIDERGEELIAKEKCLGMSYGFFKSHFCDWDCTFKYSLNMMLNFPFVRGTEPRIRFFGQRRILTADAMPTYLTVHTS